MKYPDESIASIFAGEFGSKDAPATLRLRQLLSYSEEIPEFSEEEKQKIISAIDKVKILDPACGSGAFPMGILHKLVFALQKLDPENKYWYELQYQKALKETEEVFKQSTANIPVGGGDAGGDNRSKDAHATMSNGFDIIIGNPPYIQLQKAFNKKVKYADLYKEQKYQTFERTGDIYCLFYEKGIELLKPNGLLCYITSNKWMRAGYGEKLRKYFTKHNPIILIDLGPNVFENATVDTNILLIAKQENENKLLAVTVTEKNKDDIDFTAIVKEKAVALNKLTKDAWFIGSDAEQKLKEKNRTHWQTAQRLGCENLLWNKNRTQRGFYHHHR